jgi:hypothetical protein
MSLIRVAVLTAVTFLLATGVADAHSKRLVVRGEATAVEGPCGPDGCPLTLSDGRFRGTPVGSGAYTAAFTIKVAQAFPNGDGGICAPINGRIVLGAGTADRLVIGVYGDSCQDGTGFSGLARFAVKRGTGRYAHAHGSGIASLAEDAAKHHRITLIGRIGR